ncbi:MAG: hypothetical protein R6V85_18405 [Polyangia bacterium]
MEQHERDSRIEKSLRIAGTRPFRIAAAALLLVAAFVGVWLLVVPHVENVPSVYRLAMGRAPLRQVDTRLAWTLAGLSLTAVAVGAAARLALERRTLR